MKMKRNLVWPAVVAMAMVALATTAHGAFIHEVTGWAVHNGSSTISDETTNTPTFTGAHDLTVMGTFPNFELANDGDFVQLTTTLTLNDRTAGTALNGLNTQLRIGLFSGPGGPVTFEDVPNRGIFIVYGNHNQAANRRIREQTSALQNSPFVGGDIIGDPGSEDDGSDSIQGANPGPVYFELTLTRNAGLLDIAGQISGTDSITGNPYVSNYAHTGHDPVDVGVAFNRVGFFFGPNTNATSAVLADVLVTTNVPEPSSCTLAVILAVAGVTIGRQRRHTARRRD